MLRAYAQEALVLASLSLFTGMILNAASIIEMIVLASRGMQ